MAAVAVNKLVRNIGAALQAAVADWATFVVNPTWTFVVSMTTLGGLRAVQTVINDTVNITTTKYAIADFNSTITIPPGLILSSPGIQDLSPPVLLAAYGARTTYASHRDDLWNPMWAAVKNLLAGSWSYGIAGNDMVMTSLPTGFTGYYSSFTLGFGVSGWVSQSILLIRNPATALFTAVGTFPLGNLLPYSNGQNSGASEALLSRIADALESVALSRYDVSINHGQAIFSAKGGGTTG